MPSRALQSSATRTTSDWKPLAGEPPNVLTSEGPPLAGRLALLSVGLPASSGMVATLKNSAR